MRAVASPRIEITSRLEELKDKFEQLKIYDKSIPPSFISKTLLPSFKKRFEDSLKKHEKKNGIEFCDLFAGAGGLSLGLEQAGFAPSIVVDNYKAANSTYLFNRPFLFPEQIISEDIRHWDVEMLEQTPLVVGGPPCQGFSNANKQRKENDERNELYKFFLKSVKKVNPSLFLMENVEGILVYKKVISSDFDKIGYSCHPFRLNTKDFGFPQNRKRVFFLGISKELSAIKTELVSILASIVKPKVEGFSLFDAIADLPSLEAKTIRNATNTESKKWGYTFGPMHANKGAYCALINKEKGLEFPLLNHKSKYNNDRDIKIYSLLKQGDKADAKAIEQLNPYKNRSGIFKDKFFKLQYGKAAKTITAHMYFDCHMYIHPDQARGLTPREAARIQGFPDDYLFLGSPNEWYRQIGNAVSPLLAFEIGKRLKIMIDRIYSV